MIDTFFATPFSDLFRLEINSKILPIDLDFNIIFSNANNSYMRGYVITSLTCSEVEFCVLIVANAIMRVIRIH